MGKLLIDNIIGTWELVSFQSTDDNSNITYPLGEDPHGFIMYNSDGHMSVQMAKRYRPRYASGDTFIGGTDEEILEAARGYSAYAGRFDVDEATQTLTHYMDISLNPTRIGLWEPRVARIEADILYLHSGIKPGNKIVWRRAHRFDNE